MKKYLLTALFAIFPLTAQAQSFESFDACKQLKTEIDNAIEEAKPLETLLTDETMTSEVYLEQLYRAVQILSKSGEMFFKASDAYESDCETSLKQANKLPEIRLIYDWYLLPVKQAYQFFGRAKSQAIRLGREKDVEKFVKAIREYEDSVMKIAATCESTLAGQPNATSCRVLASQLEDAVK